MAKSIPADTIPAARTDTSCHRRGCTPSGTSASRRDPAASAGHTRVMRRLLVVLALVAACGGAQRPRVDRADQLPVHRYPVTGDVGRLVVDEAAFAAVARPLRADMERDLAQLDIRDPESLKDRLFVLALLDALD